MDHKVIQLTRLVAELVHPEINNDFCRSFCFVVHLLIGCCFNFVVFLLFVLVLGTLNNNYMKKFYDER